MFLGELLEGQEIPSNPSGPDWGSMADLLRGLGGHFFGAFLGAQDFWAITFFRGHIFFENV